ncbi:MAG: hypothetical protein ACK5LM_00890, partial [Lactovum sp.]
MKKLLIILMLTSVTLLAGCSSKEKTNESSQGSTQSSQQSKAESSSNSSTSEETEVKMNLNEIENTNFKSIQGTWK